MPAKIAQFKYSYILFPGVFHAMELPYIFGYPFLKLNPEVRNDTLMFFDVFDWNEEDIEYADFMMTLWTNFAKFG